jgi:site-specific recombinase XerD
VNDHPADDILTVPIFSDNCYSRNKRLSGKNRGRGGRIDDCDGEASLMAAGIDGQVPALAAPAPLIPRLLDAEVEATRAYVAAARAPATRRAYASDWRIFLAWCEARDVAPLPAAPEAVAIFLAAEARAGVRPSTIGRRLAAIGYMHAQAGLDPPQQRAGAVAIRNAVAGIRRTHGVGKVQKRAADGDMLRDMLRACDGDTARAVRDRALLAIGMAAALRRSELVALALDDVAVTREGLTITVRRSKTDQEGAGTTIAVPEGRRIRPKALLLDWIAHAGFAAGPVFRKLTPQGRITARPMSDRGVALVVKARAAAAGYDPAQVSGHSLRAGFLTEAARQGATVFKMKEVSRHKSLEVLSDYVRSHELFRDHAGERFL